MGEAALPVVRRSFIDGRNTGFKARLAEILGRIGAAVLLAHQMAIQMDLGIALNRTRDAGLIAAILMAMDRMRPGAASAEIAMRMPITGEDPSRGPSNAATGEQRSQGAA